VDQAWKTDHNTFHGRYYRVDDLVLQPKPVSRPRPVIYAGGESEAAKNLISQKCDAYVMHGDPPDKIREKIRDLSARRDRWELPRMQFGVAAYAIVRDSRQEARAELDRITDVKQNAAGYENYQQWLANTQLEQRVSLEDYSVSNRGLRSGLVGTPEQVRERIGVREGGDLRLEERRRLRAGIALLLRERPLDGRSLRGDLRDMTLVDLLEEEGAVGDVEARRGLGRARAGPEVEHQQQDREDDPPPADAKARALRGVALGAGR